MVLLDTNILSELMRPKPSTNVINWLDNQNINDIFTSIITQIEIYQGLAVIDEGKRKQRLIQQANQMFETFEHRILAVNTHTTASYLKVFLDRKSIGRPINFQDALIAAISLEHNLTLITRNIRDFEHINHLELINPF